MALVDRMSPAERREQDEIMAVALANRGGSADPKLGCALGRFCADHKPYPLGEHLYEAGVQYGNIIREHLNAWGFRVHGWAPSDRGYAEQSDELVRARRDLADKRKRAADKILNALDPRHPGVLPRRMVGLCYDNCSSQTDGLRLGLMALSDAWGLTPKRSWE